MDTYHSIGPSHRSTEFSCLSFILELATLCCAWQWTSYGSVPSNSPASAERRTQSSQNFITPLLAALTRPGNDTDYFNQTKREERPQQLSPSHSSSGQKSDSHMKRWWAPFHSAEASSVGQSRSSPSQPVIQETSEERIPSLSLPGHGKGVDVQISAFNSAQQVSALSSSINEYSQPKPPASFGSNSNQVFGLFNPNAHNEINMQNPTFNQFQGNQNIHYYVDSVVIFDRLEVHAMLETSFDSSARGTCCHPGTRQDILDQMQEKLSDRNKIADVTWLEGAVGVGKSTIMQTIAEMQARDNTLCASLFLSGTNGCDDPQKIFPTIAYYLATRLPSYKQYLAQQMVADPSFFKKSLEEQFNKLILIPFTERQLLSGHRSYVILLDALEECKGIQEQIRIIKLIGDFVSKHPSIPLRWIISSRPEQHLVYAFSEIKKLLQSSFWSIYIPIDSEQSVRDVELYLHNEFTRIRDNYRDLIAENEEWPSKRQFLIVSMAASGFFIFASTIIQFIDNGRNPVRQLDSVVSFLDKQLNKRHVRVNPLALLDEIYEERFSDMSSDALEVARLVLGYLIICNYISTHDGSPKPFWICNILGLEQHALYEALRKLRSVLAFPRPERALEDEIHFLHSSLPDFLLDQERSRTYSVSLNQTTTYLWRRCMTILQQWMTTHSQDSIEFTWRIEHAMHPNLDISVLKYNLYELVSRTWPMILQKHFDQNTSLTFRLLLPVEEVIEQLRQIDYSYYQHFKGDTGHLITLLEVHVGASHCKNLIQDRPFASLHRQQFLRSLYERWWIDDGRPFGEFETRQTFGNNLETFEGFVRTTSTNARTILHLMDDANAPDVVVKILGAPSRCRVWFREPRENISICFPYIA